MNGKDLIKMGYKPSKAFGPMIARALEMGKEGFSLDEIDSELFLIYDEFKNPPTIPLQDPIDYDIFLDDGLNDAESENIQSVFKHMNELVKVPTIRKAAVMPDACPAGSALGTIPVGGVVAAENAIHPGMHSADICCSLFLTSLKIDPEYINTSILMDLVEKTTHFGPGGRIEFEMVDSVIELAKNNSFLNHEHILDAMQWHAGTQGDGNHFFYVGKRESTGDLTFVTHHGSRKPGALLYKAGLKAAQMRCKEIAPDVPKHNAWLDFNTEEGQSYWEALQIIRAWTKANHTLIHDGVIKAMGLTDGFISDRFWNEHNFVFKRGDLFYHAKGSTPVYGNHAEDATSKTIIPLNMAEPILIVENHSQNEFGFAPHGAGRNFSRTQHMHNKDGLKAEDILKQEISGIDARFYSGKPDISELPSAYKNAQSVCNQIEKYKLANVVDKILPIGNVMAGEIEQPWRKKK